MAKLNMMLDRGNLPRATFAAIVDPETLSDKVHDLVLKDIQGRGEKASHVVLKSLGMKVYNAEGGMGCSLRRFLFGPNYRTRVKTSASNDYTRAAFYTALEPITTNILIAVMRDVATKQYGFRYYDVDFKQCTTVVCTKEELRSSIRRQVGEELGEKFDSWFERKPYRRKTERTPEPESTEQPIEVVPEVEEPRTGTSSIAVVNEKGEEQMKFTKPLEIPAGTAPMEMDVKIPIPFTGLFISVHITTK